MTSTRYQLSESTSFTNLEDEAVLLDLTTGSYFGLNHVGVMLVDNLSTGKTVREITTIIANHYSTPLDTVQNDISSLIDDMLAKKLLIKSPSVK